jgi:beta-lactamase regulating signal transducer with metallopeptidase domain
MPNQINYILNQLTGAIYSSVWYFAFAYLFYFIIKKVCRKYINPSIEFIILLGFITVGNILFLKDLFYTSNTSFCLLIQSGVTYHFQIIVTKIISALYVVFLLCKFYRFLPRNKKNTLTPFLQIDVLQYVKELSTYIHIKVPSLFISTEAIVPYTKGFIKKIIVLPSAFLLQLTEQELAAVLLHEIAHIKRNDHFTNIIIIITDLFLSFNPFTIILLNHIKLQRELACDDWVIAQQIKPKHYASALHKSAQLYHQSFTQLAMAVLKHDLLYRIQRLFKQENKHYTKISVLPFISIIILFTFNFSMHLEKLHTTFKIKKYTSTSNYTFAKSKIIEKPLNQFVVYKTNIPENIKTNKIIAIVKPTNNKVSTNNIFIEIANSNKNILYKTITHNKTARVADNVFTLNDSLQVFNKSFTEENIINASQKAFENILHKISYMDSSSLNQNIGILATPIKIIVTQNGEENFFYNNIQLNQVGTYNADTKEWGIHFEITNGDKLIAKRFLLLSVLKKLKSISL